MVIQVGLRTTRIGTFIRRNPLSSYGKVMRHIDYLQIRIIAIQTFDAKLSLAITYVPCVI